MKCEYLHDADGVVRLTVLFESQEDMEKFKQVYEEFSALLPKKPAQVVAADQSPASES